MPVGVAGFCWGGLHTIRLSHNTADTTTENGQPLADAFFTAHPSSVSVPQDVEAIARSLSVAIGDDDAVMGIKQVREMQALLERKKDTVTSEVVIYPGAKHGFAVRASRAIPDSKETQQAQEAETQAVAWFQKQFETWKQA
jgi:dienelactone hydrolase